MKILQSRPCKCGVQNQVKRKNAKQEQRKHGLPQKIKIVSNRSHLLSVLSEIAECPIVEKKYFKLAPIFILNIFNMQGGGEEFHKFCSYSHLKEAQNIQLLPFDDEQSRSG